MLINVIQNDVLLSETEAYQRTWAATANWKGGQNKNMKIELYQENCDTVLEKFIKNMGTNKTEKAIERASKAVGGLQNC